MSADRAITEERGGHGFRLVDLIVVVFMLGVATAIVMPFIQRMRYTRDCITCNGQMMYLALSCHNANDAYGCLPPYKAPGDADPQSKFGTPGNHGSMFFFLLPFVEAGQVYDGAGFTTRAGQTAYDVNATLGAGKVTRPPLAPFAGQQSINTFHCPLDPSMPTSGQISADPESYGLPQPWGGCSYACNYLAFGNAKAIERGEIDNPDRYDPKARPPHVAPSTCPRIPASFPDGTSNTLLFAEKMAECQWTKGATAWAQAGGNLWGPAGDNAQWAPAFAMESPWHDGTTFQLRPTSAACNVAYPSTGHYDCLTVALADGSCRHISARVSGETFYALCTPNGGERLPDNFHSDPFP
jgi:hypothetical protein